MPKLKEMSLDELGTLYARVNRKIRANLNKAYGDYPNRADHELRTMVAEEMRRREAPPDATPDIRDGLQEIVNSAQKDHDRRRAGNAKEGKESEGKQAQSGEGAEGVQGGEAA